MECILTNLPSWIEALAATAVVVLTFLSLIVLKEYAADTKMIAKAGVSQIENAQRPFLAMIQVLDRAAPLSGWTIQNQGSGPAINGRWSYVQGGRFVHSIPSLAAGEGHNVQNLFPPLVGNQAGVQIEYESLSGLKYRTQIRWGADGHMLTEFGPGD